MRGYAEESAPTSHTVQRGDNLSNIANEVYGDPNLWPAIAAANGITNPDQIRPGQELVLPAQDDLNEDAARAAAGKFYAVKEQIRQAQVAAIASDVGTTSPTVSPSQAAASAAANNDNGIIPTEGLAGNVAGAFAGAGRFVSNTVEGIFGLGKTLYQGADYLLTGDETSRAGYERAAQTVKGAASLISDSYDTYAYVATGNEKYLPGFEANAARGDAIVAAAQNWKERYDAASDYEKSAMLSEGFLNVAAAVVGTKGLGEAKAVGETAALGEVAGATKALGTAEEVAALSTGAARTSEVGAVAEIGEAAPALPKNLYHYTSEANAALIEKSQLGLPGRITYLTPEAELTSLQAQIELALPQGNTGGSLFQISTEGLDTSKVMLQRRVPGNVFNRGGGGYEVLYNGPIPLENVTRIR